MVRTGKRATALLEALEDAGYRASETRVRSPRVGDLPAAAVQHVARLHVGFGGSADEIDRLRPGSWDLVLEDGSLLIELDEELHFNRYRAQTLSFPGASALPWADAYRRTCEEQEARCLAAATWGKRWSNPSCERLFGPAAEPGDFDGGGAPRWKQRALYDAMKDLFALSSDDVRVARLSVYDMLGGRSLEEALRSSSPVDPGALRELVESRAV